jgi:hypothetical protein
MRITGSPATLLVEVLDAAAFQRPFAIGFGLFPPDVRAFKGHAAFHRVPESWEF